MSDTEVILPDTLNSAWKNDKGRFGYKMLAKMGWKEDKGLGKNETGTVNAVKISKREEGLGIGMDSDKAGEAGWSQQVSGLSAVLDLLKNDFQSSSSKTTKKKRSMTKSTTVQVGMK
jgi:hypothetical protein